MLSKNLSMYGFIFIEILFSFLIFQLMLSTFIQIDNTLLRLKKYSKNINFAVLIIEEKSITCSQKYKHEKLNNFYASKGKIYNKHVVFHWICNYISFPKQYMISMLKNIKIYTKKYRYGQNIYFIFYKIFDKIITRSLIKLQIFVIWSKQYIILTTYTSILNNN